MRALVMMAAAVLAGCAGVQTREAVHEVPENASKALQIALATGLTHPQSGPLRDVTKAELESALDDEAIKGANFAGKLDDALGVGINTVGLGITVGGSATAAMRGLDFNHTGGLLVFGLGLLMHSPNRAHPAGTTQLIIWYPIADGDTSGAARKAARQDVAEKLNAAVIASLPEGAQVDEIVHNIWIRFSGFDDCPAPGEEGGCYFTASPYDPVLSTNLEGETVWMWRNHQWGDKKDAQTGLINGPRAHLERGGKSWEKDNLDEDQVFLQRFSANLPEWAWLYAPGGEGVPPVMFNEGKPHFFLEPGAEALFAGE